MPSMVRLQPSASGAVDLGGMRLGAGCHVGLLAGGGTLFLSQLPQIEAGGLLDLSDGALVIEAADAISCEALVGQLASLVAQGLIGSRSERGMGLAVLSNSEGSSALRPELGGRSVSENAAIVMYTREGDSDLNGRLDGDDYYRLDEGYLQQSAGGYGRGDLDYDGLTDGQDYFLVDRSFLLQQAAAPQAVPQSTFATSAITASAPAVFSVSAALRELDDEDDPIRAGLFSEEPMPDGEGWLYR